MLFWIQSGPSQCLCIHSHGPGAKYKTQWLLQGDVQWYSLFCLSLLSVDPSLCSGAVWEGRGVKGRPATRGLSPVAKQIIHGNARSGRCVIGSWASLELQWLPLVRVERPGVGTEILGGASLVLSTLANLTWTTSTSSGVAFILSSCWSCREVCSPQEEQSWSQQL